MAIRVRLKLKSRLGLRKEIDAIALVNSGFEADSPQILVPVEIAKELTFTRTSSRLGSKVMEQSLVL